MLREYNIVDRRSEALLAEGYVSRPVTEPYDQDLMSGVLDAEAQHETVAKGVLTKILKTKYEMTSSEADWRVRNFGKRMGVKTSDDPLPRYFPFFAVLAVALYGFRAWGLFAGKPPQHAVGDAPLGPVEYGLGFAASIAIMGFLVHGLRGGRLRRNFGVIRQVRLSTILQNVGVIAVTIATALGLHALFPGLDRSWLYLLSGSTSLAGNVALLPIHFRLLAPIFLVIFALNIPAFARDEEFEYRMGTKNWKQGVWRSLRFGMAHFWMGVPIYVCLALSIGGLWYTHQYFRHGIDRAALHHSTYNLIIVSLLAITLLGIIH